MKMYFLLKMGIFQPAMLVYQRVKPFCQVFSPFFPLWCVRIEVDCPHQSFNTSQQDRVKNREKRLVFVEQEQRCCVPAHATPRAKQGVTQWQFWSILFVKFWAKELISGPGWVGPNPVSVLCDVADDSKKCSKHSPDFQLTLGARLQL